MEQRGKGAASAVVVSQLEEVDGGTKVSMETDLTITGAVAQYGRGMMSDISQRLTREFAQCLEANISAANQPAGAGAAEGEPTTGTSNGEEGASHGDGNLGPVASVRPAPTAVAKPVHGLRLGVWAFWRAIVRFFKRLFGGKA
jgi:hypothetical protein